MHSDHSASASTMAELRTIIRTIEVQNENILKAVLSHDPSSIRAQAASGIAKEISRLELEAKFHNLEKIAHNLSDEIDRCYRASENFNSGSLKLNIYFSIMILGFGVILGMYGAKKLNIVAIDPPVTISYSNKSLIKHQPFS